MLNYHVKNAYNNILACEDYTISRVTEIASYVKQVTIIYLIYNFGIRMYISHLIYILPLYK